MRIGLISDTHSHLDEQILKNLEEVDEIWHAGDIGDKAVIDTLESLKPVKAVYGNIDHGSILYDYPLDNRFHCEQVDVYMTHIGGYPGKYKKRVKSILTKNPPKIFICGHSHICKVMYDKELQFLHINPGACGHHGFHKMRTMIRFSITEDRIHELEVIELGIRGRIKV